MLGQIRAIATGRETLTKSIFESVATDSLRLAKPVLDALREGNLQDLSAVEDVQPIEFEKLLRKQLAEQRITTRQAKTSSSFAPTIIAPLPPTATGLDVELSSDVAVPPNLVSATKAEEPSVKKATRRTRQNGNSVQKEGIVEIVEKGCKRGTDAHSTLAEADLLAPASEYQAS